MNLKTLILTTMLAATSLAAPAQDGWLKRTAYWLKHRLDSMIVQKYDSAYIEVPKQPWRVVLRTKLSDIDMSEKSTLGDEVFGMYGVDDGRLAWKTHINPAPSQSVGFYVGYRGLGFGYSLNLLKRPGLNLTFSSTGARYGLTARFRKFDISDITVEAVMTAEGKTEKMTESGTIGAPIHVTTAIIDGYWLFNSRRFSQAAAYNQSVIQRRSSGSLMLGGLYQQTKIDLSSPLNAPLVELHGNIGKLRIMQLNLGLGYGYNWVPGRGWLLNAMVMPTVSVFSKSKFYYYEFNYTQFGAIDGEIVKYYPEDDSWEKDIKVLSTSSASKHGSMQLNVNARLSVTYVWKRYFLNVFGQLNRFAYDYSNTEVRMLDWYVRGSFGVRF